MASMTATNAFTEARATLLRQREDYHAAVRELRWPQLKLLRAVQRRRDGVRL